MTFAGIDIETTGLEPGKHRLIQLGVAFVEGDHYKYDVCPEGNITIDAEALAINKFTLKRIADGMPTSEADAHIYEILSHEFKPAEITAVGWNVGSFDYSFLKREMPKFASLISHRVADLTAIAMLAAVKRGKYTNYRDIKEQWHTKAEAVLGETAIWHDALWDARAALAVWQMLAVGTLEC